MKVTLLIKENRTQVVLHPESKHDENILDVMAELPGTHRVSLYDRQGGFTMFDPPREGLHGVPTKSGDDLMIVFDTKAEAGDGQS